VAAVLARALKPGFSVRKRREFCNSNPIVPQWVAKAVFNCVALELKNSVTAFKLIFGSNAKSGLKR
jgi:hypothetical protein